MPFVVKKSQNYTDQTFKASGFGGAFRSLGGGSGGGGPAVGTPLNPYTLLTNGTPLVFTIDSSVQAEYRQFDGAAAPYYGRYATFTCPSMIAGETLNIRFGIQTDLVDDLDTYMYVFEGSTFILGGETLIDQDDDGGSGDFDVFENTLLEFPEGTLTAGQPYIIELTTYATGDGGNVKVIATVSIPYTLAAGYFFGGVTEESGNYYLRIVAADGADASLVSGFPVGATFTSSYVDGGSTPAVIGTEVSKGVYLITSGGATWRAADVDDDVWAYNDPVGEVADPLTYVSTGITLDDGVTITPVTAGGTYPYTDGDVVTLDTTDPLKNVSINVPPGAFLGTMPLDLSTVGFSSSNTYSVTTQQGVSFDLNVTVPIPNVTVKGSPVLSGDSLTHSSGAAAAVTLATTEVDTSYTITDSLSVVVASGNMPYDLRGLTDGDTYTVTASGVTFTVIMTAIPSIVGIAGKMLHLDAQGGTYITKTGTDVTAWTDISSASNNATSILEPGGAYPQYTSVFGGGVSFTGTNSTSMSTNANPGIGNASRTIFIVATVASNSVRVLSYGGTFSSELFSVRNFFSQFILSSGNGAYIFSFAGGPNWVFSRPCVVAIRNESTGNNVKGYTSTESQLFAGGVGLGTGNTYGIQLGREIYNGLTSYSENATFHEVLAYNTALSDSDVDTILLYLKLKWE